MVVIEKIISFLYVYCTDFIINLANLFKVSYFEINALIFCVIWPLLTIVLIITFAVQKMRLNYLKKK